MGKRLVISSTEGISLGELESFVKRAKDYGLTNKDTAEGGIDIHVSLPVGVVVAGGKKHVIKPKSKEEEEVAQHIKEHEESVAKGEKQPGYIPPAGKTEAPKQQKRKCPFCNTKKPVVTRSRIKRLKEHNVKGQRCEGSLMKVTDIPRRETPKKKPVKKTPAKKKSVYGNQLESKTTKKPAKKTAAKKTATKKTTEKPAKKSAKASVKKSPKKSTAKKK
jgi:hypothetical protein